MRTYSSFQASGTAPQLLEDNTLMISRDFFGDVWAPISNPEYRLWRSA